MNELRVLTGLHRGVAMPIDSNKLQIGSDFDSDLVLADPGIAPKHVILSSSDRLPPNCWKLEIGHQDIWDSNNTRVSQAYVFKLGKALNLGGVLLMVMDSSTPWPSESAVGSGKGLKIKKADKRWLSSWGVKLFGAGACVLLGSVALSFDFENEQAEKSTLLEAEFSTPMQTIEEISRSSALDVAKDSGQSLQDFKSMLKERGLQGLSLVSTELGVEVSGSLGPDELAVLERMILRYKRGSNGGTEVQNKVSLIERSLPFDVVKVVSGPYAKVETDDGTTLAVGDSYKGFKLVGIERTTLRFTGPTDLTVKW